MDDDLGITQGVNIKSLNNNLTKHPMQLARIDGCCSLTDTLYAHVQPTDSMSTTKVHHTYSQCTVDTRTSFIILNIATDLRTRSFN